jgi:hypothetical protein
LLERLGCSNFATGFIILSEEVVSPAEFISLSDDSVKDIFTRMDAARIRYSTVVGKRRSRHNHFQIKRMNSTVMIQVKARLLAQLSRLH